MTNKHLKIGIIGAGVAGLAAAWDLARAGHDVHVYESADSVGGLAAGFKDEHWDWYLEKFYHHWFQTDADILGLIDEIGHSDKVLFPRPVTRYWIDGQNHTSEITPQSVLFSLPLSLWGRLQMVPAGVFLKLTPNWRALEKVTAHDWLRRHMGQEAYKTLFRPLLIGKFGDYYDQVNMAWMWARVVKRSIRLGTFQGGFQHFLNLLGGAVQARGATLHLNTPIEQIIQQDGQPALVINGAAQRFDRVLSTSSPQVMLRMAPELAAMPYGQQMADLKSIGGLCVVLALKQQLMTDGTYWLNLPAYSPDYQQNPFPFLALVEHTNYMERAHFGGDHLVYCGDYVAPDHAYFQMDEAALVDHFLPSLKQVNPDFSPEWVRKWWVFRAPYAQPVPGINHSHHIPSLQTPLPGVYWASMSQTTVHILERG
jgi:protoporphyrinogen oxidase